MQGLTLISISSSKSPHIYLLGIDNHVLWQCMSSSLAYGYLGTKSLTKAHSPVRVTESRAGWPQDRQRMGAPECITTAAGTPMEVI